jgi:hypothetical protein
VDSFSARFPWPVARRFLFYFDDPEPDFFDTLI